MNDKKITFQLWFDKEAKDARDFYLDIFKNSEELSRSVIEDTPSGTTELYSIRLEDIQLLLMSAGPYFKLNPSISLAVKCKDKAEVDRLYERLSEGGFVAMPLDSYDFSPYFAWVMDRFGVSWQLILVEDEDITAKIVPSLMFIGENFKKAKEAIEYYTGIFSNASTLSIHENEGAVATAEFKLEDQVFAIQENDFQHDFALNEAFSIIVYCDTQEEIDALWEALSAVPESEQCGWLKDRYGVSWQIIPRVLDELMSSSDAEASSRVVEAFLQMKKFDIQALERAFRGENGF